MSLVCNHYYKFVNCFVQFQYTCSLSLPIPLLLIVRNIFSVCYIFHNPSLSHMVTAALHYLKSINLPCSMAFCLCHSSSIYSPLFAFLFLLYRNMWYCYQYLFKFIWIFTLPSLFLPFCYTIPLNLCPSFLLPVLPLLYFSLIYICLQSNAMAADWSRQIS